VSDRIVAIAMKESDWERLLGSHPVLSHSFVSAVFANPELGKGEWSYTNPGANVGFNMTSAGITTTAVFPYVAASYDPRFADLNVSSVTDGQTGKLVIEG
tara:strand:- start:163 stop:462 length:300 start_codon:yes stop_codon:yes gene_type:complete